MARRAYAVKITEENLRGVILSEAGLNYNLEYALEWLEEHGDGWFLRDPESVLDCQFIVDTVFETLYQFTSVDDHSLFRHVIPLK